MDSETIALKVGDVAPPFDTKDCLGGPISLGEFAGKKKVVLFFFPKAFTVRCVEEVRNFRDHYERIVAAGAELIGVSTDKSDRNCQFKEEEGLQFRLIGDDAHVLSTQYGVVWPSTRLNKRATFVIDERGVIAQVIHQEVAVDAHLSGVLEALKA